MSDVHSDPPGDQSGGQGYGPGYGPAYGQAYGQAYGSPGYAPQRHPDQRPGTVLAAGLITLFSSGLVALGSVLALIIFAASRDLVERELRNQPGLEPTGLDVSDVYGVVLGILVVLVVWALAACAIGVLVLRRSRVGRVLLVISAGVTALVSLLGIGSLFSALPLIASVAAIVLVFVGGANEWFAGAGGQYPQPPPSVGQYAAPPAYGGQYQQQPYAQQPYTQQPYAQQPHVPPPSYPPPSARRPREDDGRVQPPWGKPSDGDR